MGRDGDELEVVDLDAADAGPPLGSDRSRRSDGGVVEVAGAGRRAGPWVAAGLAVVAVVVALGLGGGGGGERSGGPTTTERSSRTTTSRVPRTTLPPPTMLAALEDRPGPLVPGAEGMVLVSVAHEAMVRVDLGDGSIERVPTEDVSSGSWVNGVGPAGVTVGGSDGRVRFHAIDGTTTPLPSNAQILSSDDGAWLWTTSWERQGEASRHRLGPRPEQLDATLPPNGWPVAVLGDGALLLQGPAAVHRWSPGQPPELVAQGRFLAATDDLMAHVECDEGLRCDVAVRHLVSGHEVRRTALDRTISGGSMSPGGRWLITQGGPGPRASVFDLETGTTLVLDEPELCCGQTMWSLDGRHVVAFFGDRLASIDPATGAITEGDLAPLRPQSGALGRAA